MATTAQTEDAATVLEQFTHDVANVPAEISHLLEEIQAKDQVIGECRATIAQRDNALQKFVKANNFGHVKHPKEDLWTKQVASAFEKAQSLQEEKVGLANKVAFLLDRQVKRLDRKILDLQADGVLAHDPDLPSLLQDSRGNLVGPNINPNSNSATSTGVSTPLYHPPGGSLPSHQQPYSRSVAANSSSAQIPTAGSGNIANAAMARMLHQAQMNRDTHLVNSALGVGGANQPAAPVAGMQPHPLLQSSSANASQQAPSPRDRRESSAGAVENKRKRPHGSLGALPGMPTSGLARHSSLGPSGATPKAGTPSGGGAARSGSAGPRLKKPTAASGARGSTPQSAGGVARKKGTSAASSTGAATGTASTKSGNPKKKVRRVHAAGKQETPSEAAEEEDGAESPGAGSDGENANHEAAGKKRGAREGSSTSKGRGGGAAGRRAGSQKATKKHLASKDGAADLRASQGSGASNGDAMDVDGEEEGDVAVRSKKGAGSQRDGEVGASDEEEEEEEAEEDEAEEEDVDGAYEDDGDDRLYCVCRSVSHGNMVACDNDNCRFEWFHMPCVGMTHEPKGRWLCHECRKLPASQLKLAR